MSQNKIEIFPLPSLNILKGTEALNLETGNIILITGHKQHYNHSDIGDYLMRTDRSKDFPFVSLISGTLYETNLENYTFKVIKDDCIIKRDLDI